jgi:hypothetical protein
VKSVVERARVRRLAAETEVRIDIGSMTG